MTTYKHTQTSYFMIAIAFAMLIFFSWLQIEARSEPSSVDSGANFAFTAIMTLVVIVLASFATLTVSIEDQSLKIRFGWGIFRKQFSLQDLATVRKVKNNWYHGWGIHLWLWPKIWIYNVSGFDAVEIVLKNGKVYRIGTNEPDLLEKALRA